MKRQGLVVAGIVAVVVLAAGLPWAGSNGRALATSVAGMGAPSAARDDGAAAQRLQSAGGGDEVTPPGGGEWLGPLAPLPAPIPGESLMYFVPTDNDATATVLYVKNVDAVDRTVALRGFNHDGALVFAQNVLVPASSFRRLISDALAASPPPSWTTPAPIVTNFTDFVYFASVSLAPGVQVEGYTLFNPGTGTIDPRSSQGLTPLTFQTAPLLLPGAPQNLVATASGGNVTITWAAPTSGGAVASYILEAGSAPGLANLATVPLTSTTFSASGVPRGTFYLRVRAVNALGTGPASAEATLVVP